MILKSVPEDFLVEELPAYDPSGQGGHVFVRFTKRDMTTDAAVRSIARALGCDPRAAGVAGNKDKRAVTTQTISLEPPRGTKPDALVEAAEKLRLDGIEVLWCKPHGHKLRTGHLHGNRFVIRVRGLPLEKARALADGAARLSGVPNAFGEQRFGVEQDNAVRARAIVSGKERPPRDARLLRMLHSALQSDLFNAVLRARVEAATWATALAGDVLKKTDTGGLFVCTDEAADRARAERGEVSPTGPIWGPKMMRAAGAGGEMELACARERLGEAFEAASEGALGEGTRRPLRLFVTDCRAHVEEPSYNSVATEQPGRANDSREHDASCVVEFVLPKGAFATTVMGFLEQEISG